MQRSLLSLAGKRVKANSAVNQCFYINMTAEGTSRLYHSTKNFNIAPIALPLTVSSVMLSKGNPMVMTR